MKIKCVVAVTNSNGSPDFHPVIVECTETEFCEGWHYDAAKDDAADKGFEPYLVYDEQEIPFNEKFMELFDWNEVTTIKS